MWIREIRVSYGKRLLAEQPAITLRNAKEVAALMAPLMEPEVVEVCYVLFLTVRTGVISYYKLSRGGISTTVVHPREVYQAALLANAAGIVLVHQHPSGDPTPSPDDLSVTRRVKEAGELIGIELLDHVIIGHDGRYVSVRELGVL